MKRRFKSVPLARVRRLLVRLSRLRRRVTDPLPLTPLGLGLLVGAIVQLRYLAYPELDLVWLVIGFAAVGMVLVAAGLVVFAAIWVWWTTRGAGAAERECLRFETGRPVATGFSLPALSLLPMIQLTWSWESPPASVESQRRGLRLRERVRVQQRGHANRVCRRFVIQDAFGLARVAMRREIPVEMTVVPHAGRLGETPMLVSVSGGDELPHPMGIADGDRVELRRYAPGDPARFIHWKVFGRTRKLMVRVPERALSPSRRTVAYLVAGADDEASAAAARVAVESRSLGAEWRFGADGTSEATERVDEALEMIVRSVEARERGGSGLDAFLSRADAAGPASAVIFVPPRPGAWLARVVAATRSRAPRTRYVVATDALDTRPRLPLWRRFLTVSSPLEGTPAAELEEVLRALASTRAEVVLLDRRTGKRLAAPHRSAMRALQRSREAA